MALSWSGTLPERLPVAVGLKVTLMVHEASAARLAPHYWFAQSRRLVGIPVKLTAAPPCWSLSKFLARLVVPTF